MTLVYFEIVCQEIANFILSEFYDFYSVDHFRLFMIVSPSIFPSTPINEND